MLVIMRESDRTQEFLELLTQHDRALGVYVYSLVPRTADADDILQQTKMILWRCFDQFESGTNFLAWARKTAFHQILTYRRQNVRGLHGNPHDDNVALNDWEWSHYAPSYGDIERIVIEDVSLTGVCFRDSQIDQPLEQLVKVIAQKPNPDYPKTTPKGIWFL